MTGYPTTAVSAELAKQQSVISVVVVDDQQIVLAGVAAVIAADEQLRVVGTAANVASALEVVERCAPDVVLCDIQLGAESGLALLDHLHGGRPAVVLLSSYEHPGYYAAALDRGAAGYVLKDAMVDQLVGAIKTVAAGNIAFPTGALRSRQGGSRPPSVRECEVIWQVAEGASNDEIAARLRISAKTVDSHLRALFHRYGVVSRTELAMRAVQEGWIRSARSWGGGRGAAGWIIDEEIVRAR